MATLALLAAASVARADPDPAGPAAHAVSWRCEGDSCAGARAPSDDALLRECERVVSAIGPVSRYQSRGRELSAHDLAQCNRRATRPPAD